MSEGFFRIGIQIRTQGPQSDATTMTACAEAAEQAGLDDIVVVDHIAIPPDDTEGSGGRYLDPLGALTFLAAKTRRIGLGTGVLILPYRPILPTAKVIATLQELSGCRLRLGVGVGWMQSEFNALGIPRNRRGRLFDEGLEFLTRAFSNDQITHNDQAFLFLPRPSRPPLLIGGTPPYAFDRAVAHGDGWLPMGGRRPEKFAAPARELRQRFADAGRGAPEVAVFTRLPFESPNELAQRLADWRGIGASAVIHGGVRYADAAEFSDAAIALSEARSALQSRGAAKP